MAGIVILPTVVFAIAVEELLPPPTEATPSEMVYVHSMPSTTSVSAKVESGRRSAARAGRRGWLVFMSWNVVGGISASVVGVKFSSCGVCSDWWV